MLVRSKSNIGPDGGGFGYDFEQRPLPGHAGITASAVLWGDPLTGTARNLLAAAEAVGEPGERTAAKDAEASLAELLTDGPMKATEARSKLKSAGFTDRQIRGARERLKVKPRRKGFGRESEFFWTLPGFDPAPAPNHRCHETPIDDIDAIPGEVASMASMGIDDINAAAAVAAKEDAEEAVVMPPA